MVYNMVERIMVNIKYCSTAIKKILCEGKVNCKPFMFDSILLPLEA